MGTLTRTLRTPRYPSRNYCTGDSLTDQEDSPQANQGVGWAERIAWNVHFTNMARGGFRSDQILNESFGTALTGLPLGSGPRFQGGFLWGPRPERAFCMMGINDIAQAGVNKACFDLLTPRYDIWMNLVASYGTTPYLITIPPVPETVTGVWNWDTDTSFMTGVYTGLGIRPSINKYMLDKWGDAASGGRVISLETIMGGINKTGSGGPANCRPLAYCWASNDFAHMSAAGMDAFASAVRPYALVDL